MNLSDLRPAPFNPREIEAAAIKGLGTSIAEFGDISGIVWNRRNGYLVAGHQRVKVLLEQGCWYELVGEEPLADGSEATWFERPHKVGQSVDRFPIRVVDWPDDKHKAAMVAANSALLAGEFIDDQLVDIVDELKESDLASLIEPLRLEELVDDMRPPVEVQQDEVPEPPNEPVTRLGDLWTMGEHRVLCGDATERSICESGSVDLVWTDPPYGVSYVGKTPDALTIESDGPEYVKVIRMAFHLAGQACHEGAVWYITAPPGPQFYDFATILRELGIWRQTLVWVKDSLVLGHSDYHYQHESIFYGWFPGKHHRPPNRSQVTVWSFPRPKASREHPTMKPIALVAKAIENSTDRGELIYDPFLGSGTTLIAAQQLGRRCYGIEIEPRYVDVCCQRFLNLTGESPIRESDGARFADLIACST